MTTDHTFANLAAATAAGYGESVYRDAAGVYHVTLGKHVTGDAGQADGHVRSHGKGVSQAAAETQAVSTLNLFREHRYGRDAVKGDTGSTPKNKDSHGNQRTLDAS